ncbi:hypothetical protein [Nocardia abscessus]|uniref:hypothetical protein n=1 Tax=Nocardia abscessus TaxID=120957 RepID=UPI002455A4E4|nr:hypothetical protein [Nocardia abscessus]
MPDNTIEVAVLAIAGTTVADSGLVLRAFGARRDRSGHRTRIRRGGSASTPPSLPVSTIRRHNCHPASQ